MAGITEEIEGWVREREGLTGRSVSGGATFQQNRPFQLAVAASLP